MVFVVIIMNKMLYDFGFLPALLEDYGYYLIKKNVAGCVVHVGEEDALCIYSGGCDRKSRKDLVVMDKKLCFLSTIDFLHWENEKYRIYIDTNRLSTLCPITSGEILEMLGSFMARIALGAITKYGHHKWVHSDYAIVGTFRVYRASEKQRRQDVRIVQRVRAIIDGKDHLDICSSSGSLYPNLKASYQGVFLLDTDEKKKYQQICEKVCDVSVVWQCGIKRRQLLREKKIYSWKDPAFTDYFYDMVSSPKRIQIIDRMLQLASCPDQDFLFPDEGLLETFPELRRDLSDWVFVDFETDFSKCIYLLGYYTQEDGYRCEWADHLDPGSEKPLMHKIYSVLSSFKQNGRLLCYYVAEKNFWKERCGFHRLDVYADLFDGMLDLSHVFLDGPLVIQGVFNFKLKNIASKLYEKGHIGICQPEGCLDGAQSVDLARHYFKTRSDDIGGILENYNQFDCQVLYEMVGFLQKYYLS